MLEVKSDTKGLLIPRMTTAQRNTLGSTAAAGLMVFDTDLNQFFFRNSIDWNEVSIGNLWLINGSNVYLHDSSDFVGIGTTTPSRKLEINGEWKPFRLRTSDSGPFMEFLGSSTTDWMIGSWSENFWMSTSSDNFSTWTDQFLFSTSTFRSFSDNTKTLGTSSARWSNIYSVEGNFSGLLTGNTGYFSGNFGIGTASPARKFEVNSGLNYRAARITRTTEGGFLEFVSTNATDWSIGEWGGSIRILSSADDFTNSTDQYMITETAIQPFSNNTKSIGTSTVSWNHLYVTDAHLYGNVAVGTVMASGYKLSVEGKIICTELRVDQVTNWPDYVFRNDYQLMPLDHLRKFIYKNGHLPNIPASGEIENSGMDVGDMQKRMMEKIEELTLYILQQQEQIEKLQKELEILRH